MATFRDAQNAGIPQGLMPEEPPSLLGGGNPFEWQGGNVMSNPMLMMGLSLLANPRNPGQSLLAGASIANQSQRNDMMRQRWQAEEDARVAKQKAAMQARTDQARVLADAVNQERMTPLQANAQMAGLDPGLFGQPESPYSNFQTDDFGNTFAFNKNTNAIERIGGDRMGVRAPEGASGYSNVEIGPDGVPRGINKATNQYEVIPGVTAPAEGPEPLSFADRSSVRKEVTGALKPFRELERGVATYKTAIEKGTAPGDMAAIFSYMKILDPGSVVRGDEYASVQNSGRLADRWKQYYEQAKSGKKLTDEQRADLSDLVASLYEEQSVLAKAEIDRGAEYLRAGGVEDPGKYLPKGPRYSPEDFSSLLAQRPKAQPQRSLLNTPDYVPPSMRATIEPPPAAPAEAPPYLYNPITGETINQ